MVRRMGGALSTRSLSRSGGLLLGLLAAAMLAAAPAGAAPAPDTIATVAGGPVPGPVEATTVGQRPSSLAVTRSGAPYLYVVDGAHAVVNRIDETTGQQVLFAGAGASGSSPDGSVAAGSALNEPTSVAVDEAGDVFIEEAPARVRMVPAASGTFFGREMAAGRLYTVAGTGIPGFGGDGGPATSAQLNTRAVMLPPGQIAVDAGGDLAIADAGNERLRFVPAKSASYYGRAMTAGSIYTLAGNGEEGYGGDGGVASSAKLNSPLDAAFDGLGNLFVADTENQRVRLISARNEPQFGQATTIGDIYTIAGNGKFEYSGEGVPATSGGIQLPAAVAPDGIGDILIAETNGYRVRAVPRISGGLFGKLVTAFDIYTVAGDGTAGFSGDGGLADGAQLSGGVFGLALDANGNLLVADSSNLRVRLEPENTEGLFGGLREADKIYTVAGNGTAGFSGDGLPATATELAIPTGVAVDPQGGFAISDFENNRIRFVAAGTAAFGQAMTPGYMYTVAGDGTGGFGGDGASAILAELSEPEEVAFDAAGDLVIADRFNHRVRFVPASSGTFYGQAMAAGSIYTIAGDGKGGFSGDGGPATAAELDEPADVSVDAAGNILIADAQNHRVRLLAAVSGSLYGQSVKAGDIYTIAGDGKEGFSGDGGPATAAELSTDWAVGLDPAGDVVIADSGNNRVRFVPASSGTFYGQPMVANSIYTIAGDGKGAFAGDGGPGTAAELGFPEGVSVDAAGDIAIADASNRRVRLLPARDGGMFGMPVTGGDIYTIAGVGTQGFSGDGGPATAAQLSEPDGVAFDAAGNVLVADAGNDRVRIVYGGLPPGPPLSPSVPPGPGPGSRRPVLSALRQSHPLWREGSRPARISRRGHRPPIGTTFSFALDQSATVTIRFTQAAAGRRQGRRCVAPSRHNRSHRRCRRTLTLGTLALAGHPGTDRVAFQGRLSRTRKLRPGRYTAVFTAANGAGTSPARSLTFTISR
jgi:hypothetical protein